MEAQSDGFWKGLDDDKFSLWLEGIQISVRENFLDSCEKNSGRS